MGQDSNQQSSQTSAVPEWFADAAIPPTPIAPKQPKKIPKLAFIMGGSVVFLIILVGVVISTGALNAKSNCLDVVDYKALTGIDLTADSLSPTTDFYSEYVLFKDGSIEYDNTTDSSQHGDELIRKVADFYKSHAAKPMVITINGSYFTADNESLTNQRMATLKASLQKSGIPEGVVVIAGADYIEPETALEGDGDTGEIVLSITSDPICR